MKHGKTIAVLLLAVVLGLLLFLRRDIPGIPGDPDAEDTPKATSASIISRPPVELNAVMSAEELRELDTSALQRLDLTGSTCYEEIEDFMAAHPDIEVTYAILLDGEGGTISIDPKSDSLTLVGDTHLPSLTENVKWLPRLRSVSIATDTAEASLVDALHEAAPDCSINYNMVLLEKEYPYDTEEITLNGLYAEKVDRLLADLQKFSHLTMLHIPREENDIALEDVLKIGEQNEQLNLDYQFELFGMTVSLDADRLEYENQSIGKEGVEELRALLPAMKNLQYLKLDSCDIDNDTLAALRDDFPDIKVVWRVYFGNYHCLTDTEMIWATGGSVNDGSAGVLKYCTDVKYLDLGHSLITHADFLNYMPKLEVAILAISWLEDIGPIANCPDLEYLELFSTRVSDLSPLASCTHLQHLNVSCQRNVNNVAIGPRDISCLVDALPELKRFYCTMAFVPASQQEEMKQNHPDCECEFGNVDPTKGFWRFKDGNYLNDDPSNRNERYALLCEQFGYDTLQQSGKMWSLYG